MKFFSRKPKPPGTTVLNAWCSPFDDMAQVGAMRDFVDPLIDLLAPAAARGEVNFLRMMPLPALRRGIATMRPRDVETLMVSNATGACVLNVGMAGLPRSTGPQLFRVTAVFAPGAPTSETMLALLMSRDVHYAYIRALPRDFLPLSETRIRRSLFGGSFTVKAGNGKQWLVPDPDVHAGAVRGVYPVNVLSEVALKRLASSGLGWPASMPRHGGEIWRLSAEEKAELLRLNPTRRDVLHLDAI